MLSRVMMLRPAFAAATRNQRMCNLLAQTPSRFFRPGVVNPYK